MYPYILVKDAINQQNANRVKAIIDPKLACTSCTANRQHTRLALSKVTRIDTAQHIAGLTFFTEIDRLRHLRSAQKLFEFI